MWETHDFINKYKPKNIKMIGILIGAILMTILLFVVDFTRKNKIIVSWWQWLLTILGLIYTGGVIHMIYSFIIEGSPKASLVMGLIFGFIAVIWGVLLGRLVFTVKKT